MFLGAFRGFQRLCRDMTEVQRVGISEVFQGVLENSHYVSAAFLAVSKSFKGPTVVVLGRFWGFSNYFQCISNEL